jgi:anti-sigma factor RsiW
MTACPEWIDELADAALGRPVSAPLAAHLAACAACRGDLESLRARAALLDAGVRRLVRSNPPPSLVPRTLSALPPRPSLKRIPLAWAAAALIVLGGALAVGRHRSDETRLADAARTVGGWTSPTRALLPAPSPSQPAEVPRLGVSYFDDAKEN